MGDAVSEQFDVKRSVARGILSTNLYKVYGVYDFFLIGIPHLDKDVILGKFAVLSQHVLAVATSSLIVLQRTVFNSVDFSFMELYMLQPVKSVILAKLKHCKLKIWRSSVRK